MQKNNHEVQNYQENEIDLRVLFGSLVERRSLIAGLTGFVTVLATLYALNLTPLPIYEATSSFTSPSKISVTTLNQLDLTTNTKDSIFNEFLTNLSSKDLQKQVFIEGDFITSFNTDNSPIDDVDVFIYDATDSVTVHSPKFNPDYTLVELPHSVRIEGNSAEAISEYLNSLIDMANSKTMAEITILNQLKISIRLEEILIQRRLLLDQAEKDRFSEIERIKEEDGQKIRQINDELDRARYKAKENRLNQIIALTDSVKLAKSLGIIENNFKLLNDNISDLTIAIGNSKNLPEWYLYGEKALMKRVELLENRKSDDPFIPELVILNNQLNEVQNNNLLKTLETRQDDSPFIDEIIKLDIEKNKLESKIYSVNGVNAIQLSQISLPKQASINKPNKILIVFLAFIGSFIMSIILALIMGALKPDEKAPPA